jgi:hypothetical protein
MLQTAERLAQVISREMEGLEFAATDVSISKGSFHGT